MNYNQATKLRPALLSIFDLHGDLFLGILLSFVVLFGFYIPHLAPSLLFDDSAEMQVLAYFLGIPHPTGYPVYIWLAKLFTYLPAGDVAYRVNLMSAVCGSFAIGVLYGVGLLSLPPRYPSWIKRFSSALGALAMGYSFTYWSQAIIAEVYTLHALLALLVVLFLLVWRHSGHFRNLLWAAGIWSLALGNHRSIVALVPAVGTYLLFSERSAWLARTRLWKILFVLLAVAGFDIFLFYLLWHSHLPFDQFHRNVLSVPDVYLMTPRDLEGFWATFWFVTTGKQASSMMFSAGIASQWTQLQLLPLRIASEFFATGFAFITIGFFAAWRQRAFHLLLLIWALGQLFLNLNYSTWGVEVFYIPIYLVCSVWLIHGLAVILSGVNSLVPRGYNRSVTFALLIVLATLSPYTVRWIPSIASKYKEDGRMVALAIGQRPNLRSFTRPVQWARSLVDQIPSNALVFGSWPTQFMVEYVARIEKGITTIDSYETTPFAILNEKVSKYRLKLIENNINKRPVLFLNPPPEEIQRIYSSTHIGGGVWQLRNPSK